MSILSYIYPITIFKSNTQLNNSIIVKEVNGARELYVNEILQSGLWYRTIWKKVLAAVNFDRLKGCPKILLLGLGGGDVISILSKNLNQSYEIEVVEYDQAIIQVAQKYFGIGNTSLISIYHSDAAQYIYERPKSKFDLIIIDLYQGDRIPKFVSDVGFISRIEAKLFQGGAAIFNYASGNYREKEFSKFEGVLATLFPTVKRFPVRGHMFFMVNK